MASLAKRHVFSISAAAALCSTAMASLALLYASPDLVSKYIASTADAYAGFKAWLTPPVLFLLMNGVVLSLAFTSGFLSHRQHSDYGDEVEDLVKTGRRELREDAGDEAKEAEEREKECDRKDEEEDDGFYPEVLSSFFGDGITTARRKPVLQRSASAPSPERKARYFYPMSTSLSQKLSSSPSLIPVPNPTKSVTFQAQQKALRPAHTVPKPTFEVKMPAAAIQNMNGHAEDRDVDQRADAFIGGFYENLKRQQVDPYMERLERSYGN